MSAWSTAVSKSESANTMLGFLPPSSSAIRFTVPAAAAMIDRPVARPPVNDTMSTRGSVTSGEPTSAPGPRTRLTTPSGRPASSSSPISLIVVSGVTSLGFTIAVLPAASAGASFHEICSSG